MQSGTARTWSVVVATILFASGYQSAFAQGGMGGGMGMGGGSPELDSPIVPDPQSATESSLFSFDISEFFSDPDDDALSFSAAGLPVSLNLTTDPVTGVISGTPNHADAAGSPYTVVVTAADAEFSVSDPGFTLNIIDVNNQPLLIAPIPAQAAAENVTFDLNAAAFFSDPDGDALTFSATGLPATGNLLIDPVTGVINGEPTNADALGSPYSVLVTATDPDGLFVSDTAPGFSLTVTNMNNPPAERPEPNGLPATAPNATESFEYEFDLAAFFFDADNDPLTFAVEGLPPSGNLSVNADTGLISGVPTQADTGDTPLSLLITVSDNPPFPLTPLSIGPPPLALTISALDGVDIALSVVAVPDPATIDAPVSWSFTLSNASPVLSVERVDLQVALAGVPFSFTETGDCTVSGQTLTCRAGLIPPEASIALTVSGRATQAGDVVMTATAAVPRLTGLEPPDPDPNNNTVISTLNVGESFSSGPAQTLDSPNGNALASGDINGDGYMDLVVTTASGSSTQIFLSEAKNPVIPPDPLTEIFRRLSTVPLTLGDVVNDSQDVLLVDLDDDADLDIVTANGVPGFPQGNSVFLNETVGTQPTLTSSGVPLGGEVSYGVVAADLDDNGLQDLIFANGSPNELFLNQGDGNFIAATPLGNADSRAVVVDDFDGDGLADVVFANTDVPSTAYRGLGGGTFATGVEIDVGSVVSVASDDLSGDGRSDLVFGRQSAAPPALPSNVIYVNTSTVGTLSFSPIGTTIGASPTVKVMTDDINRDGLTDIVALNTTSTHQIFVGTGNASFSLYSEQFSSSGAAGGAFGDFNNDGRVDLAVTGASGVELFLNDGRGNLGVGDTEPPVISLLGSTPIEVLVGSTYTDAGATAVDTIDGDVTARITVDNPVDTRIVGSYTVTATVTDSSGNAAAPVTRSVRVDVVVGTGGGGGGAVAAGILGLLALLLLLRSTLLLRSSER